ncbi:MAG: glycosyltransferase family 4 protein [Holosporaceae bacterium]|nr:glycosyltransferase family 4 protein [Holosporaceae bacterium]
MFLYTAYNFACYKLKYGENPDYSTYEKVILIDAFCSGDLGGIYTLAKDVIREMAQKRPNWKFIIMHKEDATAWQNIKNSENIDSFHVRVNSVAVAWFGFICNSFLMEKIRELIMALPENIRVSLGKLKFLFLYFRWLPKIDLFFDPITTYNFNDFYLPRVSVIHDLFHHDFPRLSSRPEAYESQTEAVARYSDEIITISNFSKGRILGILNVDENKVHMIHTQFSKRLHKIIKNYSDILKKYGLKKDEYIVFPSASWPQKNHRRLIKAFLRYLKSGNSKLKLVLMGSIVDSDKAMLANNFKGRIIATGFVDNDTFQAIMENALAMIHPSIYEGFGMTVLEGMNAGIPVAAGRVASVPEVAGDAVLYFDPYDIDDICRAIQEITSNQQLRKTLVEKGKKRVEKFSHKDEMINEYIRVIESVMERQKTH